MTFKFKKFSNIYMFWQNTGTKQICILEVASFFLLLIAMMLTGSTVSTMKILIDLNKNRKCMKKDTLINIIGKYQI